MNNIGSKEMRALIVGGNLNNPGNSGPSCWNGNNPASNSNWNIVSRAKFCQFIVTTLFTSSSLDEIHYYLSKQISSIQAKLWRGQKL